MQTYSFALSIRYELFVQKCMMPGQLKEKYYLIKLLNLNTTGEVTPDFETCFNKAAWGKNANQTSPFKYEGELILA